MTESIWQKILDLQISSPDAAFTFDQRLARENSWTLEYAQRVVLEYKRFLYMLSLSKRELTPSDQVDQAWHLHLSFTRSYWLDLCDDILGFKLHHIPTRGGPQEQVRFEEQYQATLDFYQEIFQEQAPQDIWPNVNQRFAHVENFVRVNSHDYWLMPRVRLQPVIFALSLSVLLTACRELGEKELYAIGVLAVAFLIIGFIFARLQKDKGKNGRGGSGGCGGGGGCGTSGCGGGGCGGCGGG